MAVFIGLQNHLKSLLCTTLWALLISFASSTDQPDGQCVPERVGRCSEGIRNFLGNMDDLTLAADAETLDRHCRAIKQTKDCLVQETSKCPEVIRGIYTRYLRPFDTIYEDLCQRQPQRQAYLKHAPCINNLAREGGPCKRSYERVRTFLSADKDWTADNATLPVFCCYFYSFYNCFHVQTEERCGQEAYEMFKKYTDYVNGNTFAGACNRYMSYTECDPVADSRSSASSAMLSGVAFSTVAFGSLIRPSSCPRWTWC